MTSRESGIRLDGRMALVTGGGRGIGRAIAQALGAAGAHVAICARSEDQLAETVRLIEDAGGRALMVAADVSDRGAVERAVAQVERHAGPIDVLVNNAGIGTAAPFAASDLDAWVHTIEVNLLGPVYCSRAVLPGMIANGRGRIINIISGAAFNPIPFMSDYCVSKAALQRFTENVAIEVAQQGVQIFAVDPGLVHTPLVDGALHSGVPFIEQMFAGMLDQGIDVPPERAAHLVVFLASGRADALSGRYLDANDDVQLVLERGDEIREADLYVLRSRR